MGSRDRKKGRASDPLVTDRNGGALTSTDCDLAASDGPGLEGLC